MLPTYRAHVSSESLNGLRTVEITGPEITDRQIGYARAADDLGETVKNWVCIMTGLGDDEFTVIIEKET